MGMEVEKYATKYIIFGKICQGFPTGGAWRGDFGKKKTAG